MRRACAAALAATSLLATTALAQPIRSAQPKIPNVALRPDLVISRAYLSEGGAPVSAVRAGSAYLICYEVKNIGAGATGPFRVTLGRPTEDDMHRQHGALGVGASSDGCFTLLAASQNSKGFSALYQTYVVGADSLHAVNESNEHNNGQSVYAAVY
jgi:subtilase family serine protease